MDNLEILKEDLQRYVKKNVWFYTGIICTVCNPSENEHFSFDSSNSSIKLHDRNCPDLFDMIEFEQRIVYIFNKLIKTVTDIVICKDSSKEVIELLPIEDMPGNFDTFKTCQEFLNLSDSVCMKFCTLKQIGFYEFPIKFFKHIKKSLKIIFYEFSTQRLKIEDYYFKYKGFSLNRQKGLKIKFPKQNGILNFQRELISSIIICQNSMCYSRMI